MSDHRLGHRHRVHPTLVLRVDEQGLSVAPLRWTFDIRQEHDRLAAQRLTDAIVVDPDHLELLACLVPGSEVRPAALIDQLAGADGERRLGLERCCEQLVAAGLLLPAEGPEPPAPPSRLEGVVEATDDPEPIVAADDDLLATVVPVALVPDGDAFALMAHDGSQRARFSADEVRVAAALVPAGSVADVAGDGVRSAVARLSAVGLVERRDAASLLIGRAIGDPARTRDRAWTHYLELLEADASDRPLLVVPIDVDEAPLLSLGVLVTYARAHLPADVLDRCRFLPSWHTSADRVARSLAAFPEGRLVLLYSLYTWNHRDNLAVAAAVREVRPDAINVAGGPDLPKYEGDAARFLAEHPEIDLAVRGEGEVTFCELLTTLARAEPLDVSRWPAELDDVAGLTFRRDGRVVRTAERERIADLDTIPSPYLAGFFDHVESLRRCFPILESNRGCPYSCTFCDWGSATASRIRTFDLARVKAEMTMAAEAGCLGIGLADANFGMLDRDVELAEHLVALHREHGSPRMFSTNTAKSRVGNTLAIVEMLAEAGILTEGLVSAQTYDPGVLSVIRRSNIKHSTFDALAAEFAAHDLPLFTDVMLGLPGSTPGTFAADLQRAVDAEVHVKCHPTQLLVNSPMNEPSYRAEHRIVGEPGGLVTATATYSGEDWSAMMRARQLFYLAERRGMLRQIATYVRAETGLAELELYEHLRMLAETSDRHPQLTYALAVASVSYLAPGSWRGLVEEVGGVVVDDLGVADDAALRTVLAVQEALFLSRGRRLPARRHLAHDYVAWHAAVVAAKAEHPGGAWVHRVPPLRSYGPGHLDVDDRRGRCERLQGASTIAGFDNNSDWELDTPIARPVPAAL